MSVIGIDFGNESCYIAVARQGGIETIANDYSLRSTPSCVSFGEKNRILGVAAKNQIVQNIKNTVVNFKRFIGKTYNDPRIKNELKCLPYNVVERKNGSIGIVVRYLGEEYNFTPTQITAMLFSKLKQTAEVALNIKVVDVVIGVPCYFDDASRHAVLEAANTAGLNVLRLMNETTAVALAYGIYKQDLPAPEEKPRNVIFVDCGQSNLQTSAVAFNKGKLKVLTTAANSNLGGRDFDYLLGMYFAKEFKTKYKIDATTNPRAWVRLMTEVEKIKKQMSANSTDLPINIECFMDDKDVTARMKRTLMEELCVAQINAIETTLNHLLVESGLKLNEIYSVEVVGGSSRTPAIKQMIEKVFKKTPSTTINADEGVARGCALQCAMLSPTFKVREFSITDVQPYPIQLIWTDDANQHSDIEVFPKNHQVPFSKLLTFYRREPFVLQAQYMAPSPCPDPFIGNFTVSDVVPTAEGESQKVKVKVRINIHGLFTVASATMLEKKEVVEDENTPMETEPQDKDITNGTDKTPPTSNQDETPAAADTSNAGEEKMDATNSPKPDETKGNEKDAGKKEEKKKMASKSIELPVQCRVRCLDMQQLNSLIEQECQMYEQDKLENDRINAKNAVEEYVYEMRGKIFDELEQFISEPDRNSFSTLLGETENWLYEDGEDCQKQVYLDKNALLKKLGEPVRMRRREREDLPKAFEYLMASVQIATKIFEAFKSGDEKYQHLDGAEMEKVEKAIKERHEYVDKKMGLVSVTPMFADVPVTAREIQSEKSLFDAIVNPIITKSKPKPKPKEEEPPPTKDEASEDATNPSSNGPVPETQTDEPKVDTSMDVD